VAAAGAALMMEPTVVCPGAGARGDVHRQGRDGSTRLRHP